MKIKNNIRIRFNFLKYLTNKWIIFLFCCIIYILGIKYIPYDKPVTTKCEVLERYGEERTHKSHIYTDFILVLKANNKIFDIKVNPSTYYNAGKNKYLWFNLDHYDIYKTNTLSNNIRHIFIIIFGLFLLIYLSALIAICIEDDF